MRILFAIIIFVFLISTSGTSLERKGGSKCSTKTFRFCRSKLPLDCKNKRGLCQNNNPREPKKKTRKVKYCKEVVCRCVCPLHHEPVCDEAGKQYNNQQCAVCDGVQPSNLQACPQPGPHPPLF